MNVIKITDENYEKFRQIYCQKCLEQKPKNYICPNSIRCKKITCRNMSLLESWINDNLHYVKKYIYNNI